MPRPTERTFFVEAYVPGLDPAAAAAMASRLRAVIEELRPEGRSVQWLRSFSLIGEETFVWMVTAARADDIAVVNERAGLGVPHIVETHPDEPDVEPSPS